MTATSPIPVLIVTFSILIIGMAPLVFFYLAVKRNARRWDEIFIPLGFTGRMFMISGRHYSRNFGGREVNVYVFKGSVLDIQMTVPVNAHLRIFQRGRIPLQMTGVLRTQPFFLQVPGLENLAFYSAETRWVEEFLEGVRAAKAIRVLMQEGADWAVYRQVDLSPGVLSFHFYETPGVKPGVIDQDTISRWVSSLEAMADELHEAGLPQYEIHSSSGKTSLRQPFDPRLLILIVAAVIGLPACIFIFLLLAFAEA